ncbi:hypothetical protein [Salinicoccus bachuensis]|uniref:Uncharacterized protein n=1 Tax=Salinicoccus bachuensis TaxID=3136731 RepID=A0ABZ3IDC9_9STAP
MPCSIPASSAGEAVTDEVISIINHFGRFARKLASMKTASNPKRALMTTS